MRFARTLILGKLYAAVPNGERSTVRHPGGVEPSMCALASLKHLRTLYWTMMQSPIRSYMVLIPALADLEYL